MLNDHFSRGQMKSKLWMVDPLKSIVSQNSLGTIAHYGGWYACSTAFIRHFEIKNYYNIEKDENCI